MFSSNKESKNKVAKGKVSSQATTLIAQHTEVCGDIAFGGNLMIEGVVRGNIVARDGEKARVHVLDTGEVTGEISAPTVIVNGRVHGDVFSSHFVELAEKAIVDGNVNYKMIEMVRGAQINGRLVFAQHKPPVEPIEKAHPKAAASENSGKSAANKGRSAQEISGHKSAVAPLKTGSSRTNSSAKSPQSK